MIHPMTLAYREVIEGLLGQIPEIHEEGDAKTSWQNLRWMLITAWDNLDQWPIDKTSRWIGFAQGVMACRGVLDVDAERDRTRPIFHEAYTAMKLEIPKTQEMK